MKIVVTKTKVEIEKTTLNKGEYNINNCEFEFSEEYENLTKVAVFTKNGSSYEVLITNDTCITPYEMFKTKGYINIGVYGYELDGEDLKLRYSPEPDIIDVKDGSYKQGETPEKPTPSLYLMPDNIKQGSNIIISREGNDLTINSFGGGSGGDAILKSDLNVSNPLGKYANGDKINAGTELETIFRGILSQTYYPTLTDPSANLSYSSNTLYKVGSTISSQNATLSFNRGSINPQYTSESKYRSGEATSYRLAITGSSASYDKSQDNGTFSIPALTRDTKGNIVLTGTVSYDAGVQPKDSDGANYEQPLPAGNKTTSKTIEFILPFYYGASDTNDISSFEGLTEDLTKKGNKTYRITTNEQYMTIIYDSSYGNLTSILDANNFELINGWSYSTKTIDGQSYNVYVSNGKTIDTNAQFIFKF